MLRFVFSCDSCRCYKRHVSKLTEKSSGIDSNKSATDIYFISGLYSASAVQNLSNSTSSLSYGPYDMGKESILKFWLCISHFKKVLIKSNAKYFSEVLIISITLIPNFEVRGNDIYCINEIATLSSP